MNTNLPAAPLEEHRLLTDEERVKLLTLLMRVRLEGVKGQRDSLLVRLALYTGARGCELLALRACDVLATRRLVLKTAKNGLNRTVPLRSHKQLDPLFFKELLAYVTLHTKSPLDVVFPISTRQWRNIWALYRPNRLKGSHCLRHTAATLFYLKGRDILKVQAILGHKNIKNTLIYAAYVEGTKGMAKSMEGAQELTIDGLDEEAA